MQVVLHFHPDWPHDLPVGGQVGALVIEAMARDGRYRSQFETGTSHGGLTAFHGGDRWRWESRLFHGRYDAAPAADRPVYGALDRGDPYGAATRFGSAHLRLRAEASVRATLCFPDSVFEPEQVGGPERADELAALADASGHDLLDHYVEAHVHGGVRFAGDPGDVEAVVLDPCHRGTAVEAAAARLGVAGKWHPGFRVAVADLPLDYRGPQALRLARRLGAATGGVLVPADVAAARRTDRHDPQTLKQVWHLLARFGRRDR